MEFVKFSIENLSQSIPPECAGIVWLTDKKLDFSMRGVYEFNYLLNGLLTKSIVNVDSHNQDGHLFIAKNFGKSFFISHNIIEKLSELDRIQKHLTVVKNSINEQKVVLIYIDSEKCDNEQIKSSLSKLFKNINFDLLNLTKIGERI